MMPFKYEYFYWKGETLIWKFQSLACKGCYFLGLPPLYGCEGNKFRLKYSCSKYKCSKNNEINGIFIKIWWLSL